MEWQMKIGKRMRILLVLMFVLTLVYAIMCVYATSNPVEGVAYAACKYDSDIPPTKWYNPEELGIVEIIEFKETAAWVRIVVDREKEPFPLQEEQPIFVWKDQFYQVMPFWVLPGLYLSSVGWQIPAGTLLSTGWLFTGILIWRKRRDNNMMIET